MTSSLREVQTSVEKNLRRWGRIETWGTCNGRTVDIYTRFWDGSLHALLWPSAGTLRVPWWLYVADLRISERVARYTGVRSLVRIYQRWVYRLVYSRAVRRWPDHAEALLDGVCETSLLLDLIRTTKQLVELSALVGDLNKLRKK